MRSYHEIKIDGFEYWYRVCGNNYGWTLYIQKPSTPQMPMQTTVKYPFWEQPIDKTMREAHYEDIAREAIKLL